MLDVVLGLNSYDMLEQVLYVCQKNVMEVCCGFLFLNAGSCGMASSVDLYGRIPLAFEGMYEVCQFNLEGGCVQDIICPVFIRVKRGVAEFQGQVVVQRA